MSPCCLDEWRLVVAEVGGVTEVAGDTEVGGGAWSSQQRGGRWWRWHVAGGWSAATAGGATPDVGSRRRMEVAAARRYSGYLAGGWSTATTGGATPRGAGLGRAACSTRGRGAVRSGPSMHPDAPWGAFPYHERRSREGKKTFRSVRFSTGASRNEERFYCQLSGTEWVVEATRTRLHACRNRRGWADDEPLRLAIFTQRQTRLVILNHRIE